jgi:hypothetical protein
MLKASALYLVIIVALVIGLICSFLVGVAYFYKTAYQQKFRYDQLVNNRASAINIFLTGAAGSYLKETTLSLFGGDADSVSLKRIPWGIYEVGTVKTFIRKDTLYKVFSAGNLLDSTKWAALYLVDKERSFSLSGKTLIRGDAYIPKAGVQEAFIDNYSYQGDKKLIMGKRHVSEAQLPALDGAKLQQLAQYLKPVAGAGSLSLPADSARQSFLQPPLIFDFKKEAKTISHLKLSGNIILYSDTTITIDSTAVFNNILVFARSISVSSGFHGNCQLFATDSIRVAPGCRFTYPSCLGIIRLQPPPVYVQAKISLGTGTTFGGVLFIDEQTVNPLKSLISIGKNVKLTGEIYAQGMLELQDQSEVDGSVFSSLFIYKTATTRYENVLVNTIIDAGSLSPYYLSSELLPAAKKKKKVLQWIESN